MKRNLLKLVLAAALTAVFFYFFARSVEWRKVPGYIADVDLLLFLLVIPAAAVHFFTRAARWRYLLLREKRDVRYRNLVAGNIVGFTVSSVFPGRLGELAKPLYLARKEGLRPGFAIATVVVERLFDVFTMCLFLGLFLLARPHFMRTHAIDPSALDRLTSWGIVGLALAAGLLILILALYFLRERAVRAFAFLLKPVPERLRERLLGLLREFIDGLNFFHTPAHLGAYTVLSFVVWTGIILFYWLLFYAYHVRLPFYLIVPYVFLTAVGASIPTPGMVGGFHYFSKVAMTSLLMIGPDLAAGMTLVAHAVQIGVTCALGYAILSAEGLTLFQLRKMGESDRR